MRAPTLAEIIAASIVVSILVLAVKRPAPPPATLFASQTLTASPVAAGSKPVSIDPISKLPPWVVPDPASLPDDSFGRSVRYGRDLIVHT